MWVPLCMLIQLLLFYQSTSFHTVNNCTKSVTELSQDVASKGLGLVYELGSEQDQQKLVSILVDTLMTGKRYCDSLCCKFVISQVCN